MPLAEYLASEQAREDVRALLTDSPAREIKLGTGRRWQKPAGHASIKAQGFEVDTMLTLNKREAWSQIRLSQRDDEMAGAMVPRVTAYYRPDGERFVVTDMGEGVRALRLRTGAKYIDILQKCRRTTRHNHFYGAFGQICDATIGAGNWERGSGIGALFDASTEADRANLPDAICRVMLASLKVSEVQP